MAERSEKEKKQRQEEVVYRVLSRVFEGKKRQAHVRISREALRTYVAAALKLYDSDKELLPKAETASERAMRLSSALHSVSPVRRVK